MKRLTFYITCLLIAMCATKQAYPQSANSATAKSSVVPNLVRFSGVAKGSTGEPLTGMVGITFALYKEQEGGAALWMETQNVQADAQGHFTVSLGATRTDGLPVEFFVSGEAKWLGVQVERQIEQPRVLLMSVPYALKAGDAETIGGLPPAAFLLANSPVLAAAAFQTNPASSGSSVIGQATISGTGTTSFLPLWTSSSNLGSSAIFQTGSGTAAKLGIGNRSPAATLDVTGGEIVRGALTSPATGVATASAGANSQPHDFAASVFDSSTKRAVNQTFQWQAEASGNNTATPTGTLNLLYGSGTARPVETGLKVNNKGVVSFAAGQTFPGSGTITDVAAGTGLSGGGTTGNVTLSLLKTCATHQVLQWNGTSWVCATLGGTITGLTAGTGLTGGGTSGSITLNLNLAALQTTNDARYAQLGGANTFSRAQLIKGTTSGLSAFASDPAGLGVLGFATRNGAGTGIGVEGLSETTNGVGVLGSGDGSQGVGVQGFGFVGVSGASAAPGGTGVSGSSSAGLGVLGTGATGVYGSTTTGGVGVFGHDATNGQGVSGLSTSGIGVKGINGTGGYGIFAQAATVDSTRPGTGVYGETFGTGSVRPGFGSDGVDGVAHNNNSGVAGINDGSGPGVYGRNSSANGGTGVFGTSTNGFGFQTDSNVSQTLSAGGWVKAMVFVDPLTSRGTGIANCYNSQNPNSSVLFVALGCGFSVTHVRQGIDLIDFGFQINDRFISATGFAGVITACILNSDNPCFADAVHPNANQVITITVSPDGTANIDSPFWIIVF